MWKVTHIYDDDYGCEERMPGDKKKAILYVVNDDGLEKQIRVDEDYLAEHFILEGSTINDEIVGEQIIMQKQDERAVESMVKCGLPLEAVYESFPQFVKDEIKEIFDRIKGEDISHEVPEMKRNCSQWQEAQDERYTCPCEH